MVSAKDVKLGLASAVLGGFMAFSPAQEANADVNNTNNTGLEARTEMIDTVHRLDSITPYDVSPVQELETSLSFRRSPAQIQAHVMNGGAPPTVKLSAQPIEFEQFVQLYINMSKAKRGASFVGVVVDTTDENWQEGHIRDVHNLVQYMISGDEENGKPGLALTDGASVAGVIPIAYDPTDRVKRYVDRDDMGNDDMEDIPVGVGEVLVVVNNHTIERLDNGSFPTDLEDVYYAILDDAVLGRFAFDMREHRESYALHVERAAGEQRKRDAINAWDYGDSTFSNQHARLGNTTGSGKASGGNGSDENAVPASLASNGL